MPNFPTATGRKIAHRRKDAQQPRRARPRNNIFTLGPARLDAQGRFIGQGDVDRGFEFFLSRKHRGEGSLRDRMDPVFATTGGLSQSRSGRALKLTYDQLRQLHALSLTTPHGRGYYTILARAVGMDRTSARHHLKPSTAMTVALQSAKATARAA